jgi:PIN domain nuclease of toxin-antitoxin system
LDAGAYLALLERSHGEGNEITAVVASTISAVTVLLAWLILREVMT